MRTYWDLDEKERAALSREDVETYVNAELMLKGVLRVAPLEFEPEPTVPEPDETWFQIRIDRYNTIATLFRTADDALAFLALRPLREESEYLDGQSVAYAVAIVDPEVVAVKRYSKATMEAIKADLRRANAARTANEKREREHGEARRKQDEALKGLWADWIASRETAQRLAKVADTYRDYLKTAGDEALAARFLGKVYTREDIVDASKWCNIAIPLPEPEVIQAPPAVVAAPVEHGDVAF